MKKALVILLALTMVMSMMAIAPIGVAAEDEIAIGSVAADYKPEGEAIKTAADFAAMKADGKYYLANDLTIEETYMESFKGTFDGNGKIITTTVSLFEQFNGTLKNLTVEGAVVDNSAATAAFDEAGSPIAHYAANEANTLIENVCNKATMTSNTKGMGGIVGNGGVAKDVKGYYYVLTLKNCANYGNIATDFASANLDSGGLIAYFPGARDTGDVQFIMEDCVNYGTVNAMGRPGGLAGVVEGSAIITNCVNNGAVQAIDNYCGGIVGRFGENAAQKKSYVMENCVNNGEIYYTGTKTIQLGGMVGFTGTIGKLHFKNCTNNADISAAQTNANAQLGGFFGGCNDSSNPDGLILFENCVNNGNVGVDGDFKDNTYIGGFVGNLNGAQYTKFVNCTNNGNIYGTTDTKNIRVGGFVGLSKYDVTVINSINNGDVTSNDKAGGFVGYMNSSRVEDFVFEGCGNNGDIKGGSQVGGIIGYANTGKYGPKMTYCFTTGNISGEKYVAGLLGYATATAAEYKYCYVAGEITCDTPATTVASGDAVTYQTEYTFNYNDTDYYFYAPYAGTVTITGNNVEMDTSIINAVASGDAVVKDAMYTFEYDGVTYLFTASAKGTVTIDAGVATIGTAVQALVPYADVVDIEVYDHRINTYAIMWQDRSNCEMNFDTVIIEEGAAGLDYSYGAGGCRSVYTSDNAIAKRAHADFVSGAVAYELNAMAGKDVFRQNLIATIFTVDEYPTTDETHAKVFSPSTGNYTNQLFEMNPDVTPPTGDATVYVVIALAVATVSLAALAVVKKRKEN